MRILVIGAGVIGSNLAADLFASGRDVTILARGEWADTLLKNGLVIDPIFSPGKKKYRIPVIRELLKDDIFDEHQADCPTYLKLEHDAKKYIS